MIATWNDHIRQQARAIAFMGLDAPPVNLGFPFLPAPTTEPRRKRHCKSARPAAARAPAHRDAGLGPLFERPLRARGPEPPAPIRPRKLRPYSMFARRQLSPAERAFRAESDALQAEFAHLKPEDPLECRPGMPGAIRPCPWASCRYHLMVTVNGAGSIKVDHGHLDPWLLEETCALDVAAKHKEGVSQERTAELMGVTEDRIRQIERDLTRVMRRKAKPLRGMVTDDDWTAPDASGRQTCRPCGGEGEIGTYGEELPCINCDGDGYRWVDANRGEHDG